MALFGSGSRKKRGLLGDGAQTPSYGDGINQHWDIADMPALMQGSAPARQPSFWQGGGKFGVRDGIAGLLAAIGDGLAQQGGGQGGAVQMLAGGRMDAMEMARKAEMQRQQQQASAQRLAAAGLTPAQAEAIAAGDAKVGDLYSKPEGPTSEMRNFQSYQGMDPVTRQQYGAYQDLTNPRFTNTPAGTQFIPRTSIGGLPQGFDPNEWEVVDGPGGGGGNATGGFPRRR